jgi:hypothetical protein
MGLFVGRHTIITLQTNLPLSTPPTYAQPKLGTMKE